MSLYINNGALGAMEHTGTAASALALSVPVAAGALLLEAESPLGIGATLMLLTALVLAFLGGAALARWQPLRNRPVLAMLRYGFLLAAAGWLLTLLMLFGGHDWPALLAGIALGGLGQGVAYRTAVGENGVRRGVQAGDGGEHRRRGGCRFADSNLRRAGRERRLFRAGVAGRPGAAGSVDGAGCGAGWGLSRRAEGKQPAGKPGGLRLGGRELLRRNGLQTDKLNGRLLQRDAEVALRPIVDIDDVLIERAFALHEYRQILRMGLRVVVQREAAV